MSALPDTMARVQDALDDRVRRARADYEKASAEAMRLHEVWLEAGRKAEDLRHRTAMRRLPKMQLPVRMEMDLT